MADIVQLRTSPPVSDIPGQLRRLADEVESGAVQTSSVLCIVVEDAEKWPAVYGWGQHLSDYGNIAVMELAKQWFIANYTATKD
jgi:hypothetical protein